MTAGKAPRHLVTTPFPLAGGIVAHITIPHDLTPDEAERMGQALKFLAIPTEGETA
jgi:hypothetical protein